MSKPKIRVAIYVDEGHGEVAVFNEVLDSCQYNLKNLLEPAPNFLGNYHAAVPYSTGISISLEGYKTNPNQAKEMNEAMEENLKNRNGQCKN